jgi:hypothetical protein
MTEQEFLKALAGGDEDVVQKLLHLLESTGARYCLIGGLAVNAYAEPVVSLDLNLVVKADKLQQLVQKAQLAGFQVKEFPHSLNLTLPGSDLRIQLKTDPRYQDFIARGEPRRVLGYPLHVAAARDVLQGKMWAQEDAARRLSKRQKDLADILRLIEANPELGEHLPSRLQDLLQE